MHVAERSTALVPCVRKFTDKTLPLPGIRYIKLYFYHRTRGTARWLVMVAFALNGAVPAGLFLSGVCFFLAGCSARAAYRIQVLGWCSESMACTLRARNSVSALNLN